MSKVAGGQPLALDAGSSMLDHASSERRLEFVQAVVNRALSLFRGGQLDSADVLFATLDKEPSVRPMVQHVRGVIALHRGDDERALDLIEESIRLNPADGDAHANFGLLLLKVRQHPQALAAYASAVTLSPANPAAQFGLARVLAVLDMPDFADEVFRDVFARVPDYVEAIVDFGALLNDMGRCDEAATLLRDALERHPEQVQLHTVLSVSLFGLGDWLAAWPEYERRLADPELTRWLLPTDRPRWRGEDLNDRTILLQSEQGLGDTLQFVRYASMVKACGGRVLLRAPNALLPLMRTVPGVDLVVDMEETAPAFDVHVPLLSLPLIFGTQINSVPDETPYITPDAQLVERWHERLGAHAGLSVGLVWQGNPRNPNDRRRSVPLDRLVPLLDCPGVRFVSLQVGHGQEQLVGLEGRLIDAGADIDATSFGDAAAIIANLDLVISIDSAIAHLAGAIGKPAWIMLAKAGDWRWLHEREDTPWYPQARLFRQVKPGDWGDVVAGVRAALWSLAGVDAPAVTDRRASDPVTAAALRLTAAPRAGDPVICDALFVEATRQYRANNFERSRRLFEHILSLDPSHVNTLCNLGALELGAGHGARALLLLQTAVATAPDLAPAHIALADALLDGKRGEQALEQYRKAINLDPRSAAAHVAYATGLRKLICAERADGFDAEAARRLMDHHFREALKLAPADAGVHAGYAMGLRDTGDLDGAMAQFLAATQIDQRQSPEFYEALGRTCAARGNSHGAEVSLSHAVALNPELASAHSALGDLYLTLARRDEAAASFRRALDIEASNATALRGIELATQQQRASPVAEMT
jgi:tetratricopeptide (TPR) repeat protein